jgi:preprotein translocase subunit YajC
MFLNSLAAQTAGTSAGSSLQMLLPIVLVFGVMYFLIIRPQNKRMKDQQTMQSSIKIGDTVATTGGLIGRVVKLEEKEIHVDFNRAGQPVRVLRSAVVGLVESANKAKAMTQSAHEKSAHEKPAQEKAKAAEKSEATGEPQAQKPRARSPMNRGRAGGNRRPAPKKSEE